MRRGEVWWAQFEAQHPVVLLSDDASRAEGPPGIGFRAVQIVAASGAEIGELGIEVEVGTREGLPFHGVVRVAFPRPGFVPCTWVTTVGPDDLVEPVGTLSAAKLIEIDAALERGDCAVPASAAAESALAQIRELLRRGTMPTAQISRGFVARAADA